MPTYTAPTTRTTGELISAAIFNTDLVENIKYFKDAPAFAGNVTVGGTLGVTGVATLTGALAANGGITVDSTAFIVADTTGNMTCGTATTGLINSQTISSAANFTGTLGVAGLLTVSGAGTNTFSAGSNAMQSLNLTNTTSGTAARSYFGVNAGTTSFYVQAFSQGYTTSGNNIASSTLLESTGTAGLSIAANNASGAIRFYAGGTTERMTIQTNGYVGIGVTSSMGGKLSVTADPSVDAGFVFNATGSGSGTVGRFQSTGTNVGSITVTTSATAYNTSSDKRLKTDLGVVTSTDLLSRTVIHDFHWIADGSRARGVFAQEAYAVAPFAISVGSDEVQDGRLAHPWSVDYSKFVPDLIVGWQQHDKELFDNGVSIITQLAARIAALETKDH